MNISILGVGYVGLVSGVCLAEKGKVIFCIDKDRDKIKKIKEGVPPIYEPGLENLLKTNLERIYPTTNARVAIEKSDVIFIAVGTPFGKRRINLKYIEQASKEIGKIIKDTSGYKVIVVKSTVIPGTTLNVVKPIVFKESKKAENDIGFCMNPEFLREGSAVEDFLNPDRIILGVTSKKVEGIMREVYSAFSEYDILVTNPTTAEMIKYTANSFLALTISYANEIARICENLDNVDSEEVFRGVFFDKRISPIVKNKRVFPELTTYLRSGCGFGGSCLPKDVKALLAFEKELGVQGSLLDGILSINKSQTEHIFQYGIRSFNGNARNITILGTAFKPNTDDVRESPGIKIAKIALNKGLRVTVHDFIALDNTKRIFGNKIYYFENPLEAIREADIIFVTTIWDEYLNISDEEFEKNMKPHAVMIDCRSLYRGRENKSWRKRIGFNYNPPA